MKKIPLVGKYSHLSALVDDADYELVSQRPAQFPGGEMTQPTGHPADPHSHLLGTSQPCLVHKRHIPEPHINHIHHVWPKGDGGPDISDNTVVICPTGHYSVHELIKEFKLYQGKVPYSVLRQYSLGERKYAELGYRRMTRNAM